MPFARLIATAPTDDPERTLLLFCPEQGGWHTEVFKAAISALSKG
jgi:hypothetical protein